MSIKVLHKEDSRFFYGVTISDEGAVTPWMRPKQHELPLSLKDNQWTHFGFYRADSEIEESVEGEDRLRVIEQLKKDRDSLVRLKNYFLDRDERVRDEYVS